MEKHICRHCLNDDSVIGIQFDEHGVCSYCRTYEEWNARLSDYQSLHALWMERVNKCRGHGSYDVLVGISGGKDSTYVLHQLLYKYQLRVRTFTFDNGFLNEWTRNRIEGVVKDFDVEHSYLTYPQNKLSKQYRNSIALTGAPCTACSIMVYASTLALAHELNIPMAVHGRSRPQMLRYFSRETPDLFLPLVYAGLSGVGEVDLTQLYAGLEERINKTLGNGLLDVVKTWSPDFTMVNPVEFAPFFLYHSYDELSIVEFLERNTHWRRPPDYDVLTHQDCVAHDAAAYLYGIIEGRPHILPEISVMIREGVITREEAIKRLNTEDLSGRPVSSLGKLASFIEMAPAELEERVHRLAEKVTRH